MTESIQEQIPDNHCFGCGTLNPDGLHIRSRWQGDESVCVWTPHPEHMAGPTHILNGGIIATVIDCHTVCTAIADAYRREGRDIGAEPTLWYATGRLSLHYLRPTPLDAPLTLRAHIVESGERKTILACSLHSESEVRVEAEVVAVRVPPAWRHGGTGR